MKKTYRKLNEFDLIETYFSPLSKTLEGAFGLCDDAAVLTVPPGESLVVTLDTLVEGVHFLKGSDPGPLAHKLLRVNLSDLAAMGAKPASYVLSLALPGDVEPLWIARFASALGQDQETYGIYLAGGDTVVTPGPMTLTVAAHGTVVKGRELRRSGARPGDTVYVSGTLGDAAFGLKCLQGKIPGLTGEQRKFLTGRYLKPRPRVDLGLRLFGLASAATDISDGLVADLGHMCSASGVEAVVEWGRVPLSDAVGAILAGSPQEIPTVVAGGDDYELLFTVPAYKTENIPSLAKDLGISLTPLGEIIEGASRGKVRVVDGDGGEIPLPSGGYVHFGDS
mgnify:CR=1 FL=1